MKKSKLLMLLILTSILFLCPSCTKTKRYKLYVAVSPDYAPFEFIDLSKDGDDKYVGADIELAKYIAKKLNLELVIKSMAFDSILSDLYSGKSDLAISGLTATPGRRANYLFSTGYYAEGEGNQKLVISKDNINKYQTLEDFDKKEIKVGAQSGSYQASIAEAQLKNATLVLFEDLSNALTLLENGTYDAVVMAEAPAITMTLKKPKLAISIAEFKEEESAFHVVANKKNVDLMEQVNDIIKEVNDNNLYYMWVNEAIKIVEKVEGKLDELIPEEEKNEESM